MNRSADSCKKRHTGHTTRTSKRAHSGQQRCDDCAALVHLLFINTGVLLPQTIFHFTHEDINIVCQCSLRMTVEKRLRVFYNKIRNIKEDRPFPLKIWTRFVCYLFFLPNLAPWQGSRISSEQKYLHLCRYNPPSSWSEIVRDQVNADSTSFLTSFALNSCSLTLTKWQLSTKNFQNKMLLKIDCRIPAMLIVVNLQKTLLCNFGSTRLHTHTMIADNHKSMRDGIHPQLRGCIINALSVEAYCHMLL